jgi:hypothetical protein
MLFERHPPMLKRLETYFEFSRLGTNWRTEILAGITTFLTMAYIVLVNPVILSASGMPIAAVTAAERPSGGAKTQPRCIGFAGVVQIPGGYSPGGRSGCSGMPIQQAR